MKNVSTEERQVPTYKWRIWPSLLVIVVGLLTARGGLWLFMSYISNVFVRHLVPDWAGFILYFVLGIMLMVVGAGICYTQAKVAYFRLSIGTWQRERLERNPSAWSPPEELIQLRLACTYKEQERSAEPI